MDVALIDEGWSSTLVFAQSLARAGHRVTVVTANGRAGHYRWQGVDWLAAPRLGPALVAAIDELAVDHVIPTTETAMLALWDADPPWRAKLFPPAEPWQRALVRDKHACLAHLAARGIAVPRHVELDHPDPIGALGLPLVVKGASGSAGERVMIVESRGELAAALAHARTVDDRWILQEHVASPTFIVGGLFERGRPLRAWAGHKLEQFPARIGPAVRVRSTHDRALLATGLAAIGELAWTGFASADLVCDRRGCYRVLEINPRLWGSVDGALGANVDLFGAFGELLAGRVPPANLAYDPEVECRIYPRYLAAHPLRWSLRRVPALVGQLRRALAGGFRP
jgi:hypothetical protein